MAAQTNGLLPISQQSLFPLSSLAYHNYEGLALNPAEKARLVEDLGSANFMILRNHGLLTCGPGVADSFLFMYILQQACRIQILAQSGGGDLIQIPAPILAGIQAQSQEVLKHAGGALAWPGLLRKLDRLNPGYKD